MPVWEMMANSGVGQTTQITPIYIKNIVSTKSPRNIHNTSFYTNLGVMNPFLMGFLVIAGQKVRETKMVCFHQNIVQHYKIHEL